MDAKAKRLGWVALAAGLVAAALPAGLWAAGPPRGPRPGAADMHDLDDGRRLQELFQDISTINLLNGLRLTREQTGRLLALARKADELRSRGPYAQFYRKALREAVAAYEAFKAEALKGEPPGRLLSGRAVTQEFRIQNIRNRRAKLIDQQAARFDAELKTVLTEGQLQIVESFQPCLVPPRDLKDPVRAGQVASGRGVRMLAALRKLPAPQWEREKERIAERHVRRAVEGPHIQITSDAARAAAKQRVVELVEKARGMSDVEFEMEKGTLAAKLSPKESRREVFERAKVARPKALPHKVSRATRWLLHPRIIPILEERLKTGTAFEAAPGAADNGST